jgi:hypothetical protein
MSIFTVSTLRLDSKFLVSVYFLGFLFASDAVSATEAAGIDQSLDVAISRCEKIGYRQGSNDYRDCVREQLRLLANSDAKVSEQGPSIPAPDVSVSAPVTQKAVPRKTLGFARIAKMPGTGEINKLVKARKMLGAVTTIRVCVDKSGALIGDPAIAYSSADEVFDKAAVEYSKKGRYTPPPESETISGGCVTFRVQAQQNYDEKPIPIEVVNALVEAGKSSEKFELAGASLQSIRQPRESSDSPLVELHYSLIDSNSGGGSDRSPAEEFEFRRWQLAHKLCVSGEWSALVGSGVRVVGRFTTPRESGVPSFELLVNAPVCERQGLRIRADRGDKDAAYALGASFRRGGVIWRENPEAYFWFSIAEKLGHPDAQRMRFETAKYLNSPQIDRMRERVEKWAPTENGSAVQ